MSDIIQFSTCLESERTVPSAERKVYWNYQIIWPIWEELWRNNIDIGKDTKSFYLNDCHRLRKLVVCLATRLSTATWSPTQVSHSKTWREQPNKAFVEYIELPHLLITDLTERWAPEEKKGLILIDNNYRLANTEPTSVYVMSSQQVILNSTNLLASFYKRDILNNAVKVSKLQMLWRWTQVRR